MRLKYEPSSELLHIFAVPLYLIPVPSDVRGGKAGSLIRKHASEENETIRQPTPSRSRLHGCTPEPDACSRLLRSDVERIWHGPDSAGQILAVTFRTKSLRPVKLFPRRSEAALQE